MPPRVADHRRLSRAPSARRSRPGGRVLGRLAALLAVVLGAGLVVWSFPATAQTSEDAAARAAREIQAARDRANAAAQAFFEAEGELHVLEDRAEALELEAEQLEATVAELQSEVESVAVNRFVTSGAGGIPLLTGIQAPQEQVQAEVFVDILTNVSSDAFDQYDVARADLERTRAELAAQEAAIEQQRATFAELQAQAEAEVEHLREVEEQRLQDEAVQRALAAQLAAEQAEAEEASRQAAAAASNAVSRSAVISAFRRWYWDSLSSTSVTCRSANSANIREYLSSI